MSAPIVLSSHLGMGQFVLSPEMPIVYRLTECCGASAKGSSSGPYVVCRACYKRLPDVMGDAWEVDDSRGWQRYADYVACWALSEGMGSVEAAEYGERSRARVENYVAGLQTVA